MAAQNKNTSPDRESLLRAWLPRVLLLGMIWGIAVFLWSTFGAWTNRQYLDHERALAEMHVGPTKGWLTNAVGMLERLATDRRLAEGMELPAGVESLPVQRVLYEYSYLTQQNEVYVVDVAHKRVGRTAGAPPLPQATVERLAEVYDGSERMVLGMGQRGGQMLLVQKVIAPPPYRLLAMVPVNLSMLAQSQPPSRLPEKRELGLVVPHAGGWALWREGDQGLEVDEPLNTAMKQGENHFEHKPWLTVLVPLPGWPQVALALQSPGGVSGTRLLPQLLVGLWALAMSLMVLWRSAEAYRHKALGAVGPALAPLGKLARPLGGAIHSLKDALGTYWNDATKEAPLVDGPGAVEQRDFASVGEMMAKVGGGKRRAVARKPLRLPEAAAPDIDAARKAKTKGGAKPERPAMAWPEGEDRVRRETSSAKREAPLDPEDIDALVEDCLKKKRIRLLYQPIFRAGDNMPVMHEVYARLVRSDGRMITPDVFLPVAARLKLTLELDISVLKKVVSEHFRGGGAPVTSLALNISSTSLDGLAYLQEMANQGPRVLQKISFEVNSQEMIRDPKALRLLKELQKHGGNLAVDYFGGGVAMLEASRAMGFNYVKMNAARFIGTDAGKKELIELCRHARERGLPIILERIENRMEETFARRAGVEFLQGYGLARPTENLTMQALPMALDGITNLAPRAE